MGSFEVELYVKHAPRTCKNFLELARRGYYNGTIVSPIPPLISYKSSKGVHHLIGSNHHTSRIVKRCISHRHTGSSAIS